MSQLRYFAAFNAPLNMYKCESTFSHTEKCSGLINRVSLEYSTRKDA